jgi:hypothetical protein
MRWSKHQTDVNPFFSASFAAEEARSNVDVKVGSTTPNFALAWVKLSHQEKSYFDSQILSNVFKNTLISSKVL